MWSQRWQQDSLHHKRIYFLCTPLCLVWSGLVLNCCERSCRSTDGWVPVTENLNFICHLCARACVCLCAYVPVCLHVCLLLSLAVTPSNLNVESMWSATLPAPKEAPDTQAPWHVFSIQRQGHPKTALLKPGPVKRTSDNMKAGRGWTLVLPRPALGNSLFHGQILELSSQQIWASAAEKTSHFAQLRGAVWHSYGISEKPFQFYNESVL